MLTKDMVRDNLLEAAQKSKLDGLLTDSEYNEIKEEIELFLISGMDEREYVQEPQDNEKGYWAIIQTYPLGWE